MAKVSKIEIQPVPSQYTEGAWSRVVVRLGWCFNGTAVSILEERSALAVGHRLVAEALEQMPPSEQWTLATSVTESYGDTTGIRITLELANGDSDEMERARSFISALTQTLT